VTEATSPSSTTRSVVDASAVVRAHIGHDAVAQQWLETEVFWPTLVYSEVANALLRLHRHGLSIDRARAALDAVLALDANARPIESLVRAAWATAHSRSLTVYDACYVVLAEALDAPLVTADRRLAAATPNAVLLS
jgi:predicted nucleic acid-binding protein